LRYGKISNNIGYIYTTAIFRTGLAIQI
jgi:hypothetical protein